MSDAPGGRQSFLRRIFALPWSMQRRRRQSREIDFWRLQALFNNFRRILFENNAILEDMAHLERVLGGEYIFDRAFLDQAVRSGKALYAGISSYSAEQTRRASTILNSLGTPCLIHQPSYSMLNRWIEPDLVEATGELGIGIIAFCPLAQGLLTSRYLQDIPTDSRAAKPSGFLQASTITEELRLKLRDLSAVAAGGGRSLAQLALAWVLRDDRVTSALIGASRVSQIEENVKTLDNLTISDEDLAKIDEILGR